MARKIEGSKAALKRARKKGKGRDVNTLNKKKYFLIYCEGQVTEPKYFEALSKKLPPRVLDVRDFEIEGTGRNTTSLVQFALDKRDSLRDQLRTVDKLWVVFDKDSFPDDQFNAAIQICNSQNDVDAAWTNEAFELWFLLYFELYPSGLSRDQYKKKIEGHLKRHIPDYSYEKNSEDTFALLEQYGSRETAKTNAKNLEEQFTGRTDYSNHNPCTKVHLLVEELEELYQTLVEQKEIEE
jgi:hypothetical protein